jgi:diguanylate cyclase (GGDEF)-like protein
MSRTARVAIIADDEAVGRLLLAETAQAAGLEPLTFDNGETALAAALGNDVAIVLLDVDMPGMDGYEVCRRLRGELRFASVPIVMVTGHEDPAAIAKAFEAGATDFVTKPVNWSLLPRRLAYILRNSAAAERIERLAYYDPLTGLANRQRCLEYTELTFEEATASGEEVAAIYLDLNSFKKVNDTFGHMIGDFVLREVADRLRLVAQGYNQGGTVFLSRFGGDEFVVILRNVEARRGALGIANACLDCLRHPITYDGLDFYAAPSIGVAMFPHDGADVASVLNHADTAMNEAKSDAKGSIVTYSAALSSRQQDWLELESRLRRALHDGSLYLVYQPKFRLSDQALVGVEALLRWNDAEFGEIPPIRFIEIAEESGLIIDLGAWVMRAACQQLKSWQALGVSVPIAINVSAKELLHADPAKVLEEETASAGVASALIEIEITESLLVEDSASVRDALQRLRNLGCRIALDDFGTGYSSLAYITRFPPDRIKIDKTFVTNLDRSASDAAVAGAILSLGKSLGVSITAEGIERSGQLDWLRKRGCDEGQGFLLSRPISARQLEEKYFSQPEAESSGWVGSASRP